MMTFAGWYNSNHFGVGRREGMNFKVVSLDMFQTLVDVNSRRHQVFKKILGDSYSPIFAEECWDDANKILVKYFSKYVNEQGAFYNTKYIFENCYKELFSVKGIQFEPKIGAEILASEHGYSDCYEDTEMFLEYVRKYYPICLVSDTDFDMVTPLLERFKFDKVFLSEELKYYKFSNESSTFNRVLDYYKVNPNEIIHVGDSYSDVAGANRVGITTCWLNRNKVEWKHELQPDYIVSSLIDVAKLLGIEIGNIA